MTARLIGLWCALAALSACSDDPVQQAAPKLPGDDRVLAEVENRPITAFDVELALDETLGPQMAASVGAEARTTMLDSLVQSRAMAHARTKEMSGLERAVLERRVAAYRDKLLVQQYIDAHGGTAEVTDEMVEKHYRDNLGDYGERTVRKYELLMSTRDVNPQEREGILDAMKGAAEVKDWEAWAGTLGKQGLPVAYRLGEDDRQVLVPKLREYVYSAKVGAVAAPILLQGRVYLARVLSEDKQQARPLADVRASIRKSLRPVKTSEAIKSLTAHVMADTHVSYASGKGSE